MGDQLIRDSVEAHQNAIDIYEKARRLDDGPEKVRMMREAYGWERSSADSLDCCDVDPKSCAVLYSSAAWMAFHGGLYKAAIGCCDCGLELGNIDQRTTDQLLECKQKSGAALEAA